MDPREIFDYKCSSCKRMGEPGDFGINERTGAKLKTCKICRRKRLERENAFRERQIAFNNVFIPFETQMPDPTDLTSTDGLGPHRIFIIPASSSEIEPPPREAAEPEAEPEPEETPERVGS